MSENSQVLNFKFNRYDPPIFKEVKDGELVIYGRNPNDLFPDFLIDLYNKSSNHSAAINAKYRYTFGGGWVAHTKVMTLSDRAIYSEKINNINQAGDSLNDLTEKIGIDYYIHGSFAIEVIYGKTGKKWTDLNFVPISGIRALKLKDGLIKYCYLPNWKGVSKYDVAKDKEGFKEWWPFGSDKGGESQLFYFRNSRPIKSGESDVYAQPSYIAALPWIDLDSRTGVFHLNNLRNNFSVGSMLNLFNGEPTPERKDQIIKELKAHFAGENAEETGGVMVSFNKPGSTPATMDRMSAGDQDKLYLQVSEFARTGIFTVHNIPQSLMSIPTDNAFSKDDIQKDFDFFNNTYVKPIRENVFERSINYLMSFNGLNPLFKLKPVTLFPIGEGMDEDKANTLQTINALSPLLAAKVLESLTKEQILGLVGIEPIASVTTVRSDIQEFSEVGEMETFFSFDLAVDGDGNLFTDSYYKNLHFAKILDIDLSDFDADMLSVIQKNPEISLEALSVGLKKPIDKVEVRLQRLIDNGALSGSIGSLKITKVANNTVKEEDIALDLQVRYFYEGPDDSRTRTWCKDMLDKSNAKKNGYTFAELQLLTPSEANYDGNNFNNRGGFWTRKGTNETTTYCRHKWTAKSVRIK